MTSTLVRDNGVASAGAVATFVLGGSGEPNRALQILLDAQAVVLDASRMFAIFSRTAQALVLLELHLPRAHRGDGELTPLTRTNLMAAADLCEELGDDLLAADRDWACITASLQAECLFLLEGDNEGSRTLAVLARSETIFAKIERPCPEAERRHEYNLKLLETGNPPATSADFLGGLITALPY